MPKGVKGHLPEGAGDECRVRSGEASVRLEAERAFTTLAPGEALVRCSKYDVTLKVEELASLIIEGPHTLGDGEFTLTATAKSGAPFDFTLLGTDAIAWTWPDFMLLRYPTCGHMMPLCVGTLGNGTRMKGYVLNQKTGEGFITATVAGVEAKHAVTGVLR